MLGAGGGPDISSDLSPGIKCLRFKGVPAQPNSTWHVYCIGAGLAWFMLCYYMRIHAYARIPGTNARVKGALVISIHGCAVVSLRGYLHSLAKVHTSSQGRTIQVSQPME